MSTKSLRVAPKTARRSPLTSAGPRIRSRWSCATGFGRDGVTLIEIVVAVGIIGLLLGLTVPAVQRVRESSRKMECSSRLREIMRGASDYHSQHRRFPPSRPGDSSFAVPQVHSVFSIHVSILPQIGEQALFRQVNFQELAPALMQSPPSSTLNSGLLTSTVRLFQCPSDLRKAGSVSYRASAGTSPGSHETIGVDPPTAALGGLVSNKGRRVEEIRDGLSQTVGFAERMIGSHDSGQPVPERDIRLLGTGNFLTADDAAAGCQSGSLSAPMDPYLGTSWLPGGYHTTWYNHILPPNSTISDCAASTLSSGHAALTARSPHAGGVTVAMLDGSVRFVNSQIALRVWRAIGTVSGRETVSFE